MARRMVSGRIKYFKFSDLETSPWQPPQRTEIRLEELMALINTDGLAKMPTVDKNGRIIDGHRRIEAMKRLGWDGHDLIELNVVDSDGKYFLASNTGILEMTGNMSVYTYSKGGKVKPTIARAIDSIVQIGGQEALTKLLRKGSNPISLYSLFSRTKAYVDFRGLTDQELLDWIFQQSTNRVREALAGQIQKSFLKQLIKDKAEVPNTKGSAVWAIAKKAYDKKIAA